LASASSASQVRLVRRSPAHCRVIFDIPPLGLMGPPIVAQMREVVTALEADDQVKVVVFESAVEGFFLNHSDFLARFGPDGPGPGGAQRSRTMSPAGRAQQIRTLPSAGAESGSGR